MLLIIAMHIANEVGHGPFLTDPTHHLIWTYPEPTATNSYIQAYKLVRIFN